MKSSTIPQALRQAAHADWRVLEALFDHVPDTAFFVKDGHGRYLAVNQSFVDRCGLRDKREVTGRHVREVYPPELAARYEAQDNAVLRSGREVLDRLELHWRTRRRPGWCLTTKFPLRDAADRIVGVIGISRDIGAQCNSGSVPGGVASALELLENRYGESLSPALLARHAGLTPVRFARVIKRIFRLTPSQLITKKRLSAAAELLEETNDSIAEVGIACGFYDHSAFTRAFRSATGLTPTQFRAERVA